MSVYRVTDVSSGILHSTINKHAFLLIPLCMLFSYFLASICFPKPKAFISVMIKDSCYALTAFNYPLKFLSIIVTVKFKCFIFRYLRAKTTPSIRYQKETQKYYTKQVVWPIHQKKNSHQLCFYFYSGTEIQNSIQHILQWVNSQKKEFEAFPEIGILCSPGSKAVMLLVNFFL